MGTLEDKVKDRAFVPTPVIVFTTAAGYVVNEASLSLALTYTPLAGGPFYIKWWHEQLTGCVGLGHHKSYPAALERRCSGVLYVAAPEIKTSSVMG